MFDFYDELAKGGWVMIPIGLVSVLSGPAGQLHDPLDHPALLLFPAQEPENVLLPAEDVEEDIDGFPLPLLLRDLRGTA